MDAREIKHNSYLIIFHTSSKKFTMIIVADCFLAGSWTQLFTEKMQWGKNNVEIICAKNPALGAMLLT
jgi:hypothetical protein